MTRILTALFLGLFLGIVAGILLWPFLVFWRSGAEPDEPAVTEPAGLFV